MFYKITDFVRKFKLKAHNGMMLLMLRYCMGYSAKKVKIGTKWRQRNT